MNNFSNEDLLEIAKQRTQREILASQIARKTKQVPFAKRWLSSLGTWMVESGEKLQGLNTEALQTKHMRFSHDKARKARV